MFIFLFLLLEIYQYLYLFTKLETYNKRERVNQWHHSKKTLN